MKTEADLLLEENISLRDSVEVLQSLLSAERAMHNRDNVDFSERLNNYKEKVKDLEEDIKVLQGLLSDASNSIDRAINYMDENENGNDVIGG